MRTLLSSCALLFGTCLVPAQSASPAPTTPAPAPLTATELAATKTRLATALLKAATQADTAFKMKWGPDKKGKGDDPFARAMGAMNTGTLSGSWHQDLVRVVWDNDSDDELLIAGRRMLAKDGTHDWSLRAARFADGNSMAYAPDVQGLLQHLARWDLAVAQRAVASLDDRPVEVITVTLNADQVADAVWAGLLPEAVVTAMGNGRVFRMIGAMGGGGGGGRPPAARPESTIDLAVHLDPATSVVHKLHFRGWTKENAGGAPGVVMVAGGAARIGGADDEEEEEDEAEEAPAKKDEPLVYENGLPKRPRKKTSVCDVTITLSNHGATKPPELSDAQKQLLGR